MALLRALVVDRRPVHRMYVHTLLAACGFDCVTVSDGRAAMLFASPEGIDLIVTRMEAPQGDDVDLLRLVGLGAFGKNPPPVLVHARRACPKVVAERLQTCPSASLLSEFSPPRFMKKVQRVFADMEQRTAT